MKGRLDQLAIVAKYFIRAKKKCDILHTNKINLILKSAGAVAIRILTHPTDRLMNFNQYCFQCFERLLSTQCIEYIGSIDM